MYWRAWVRVWLRMWRWWWVVGVYVYVCERGIKLLSQTIQNDTRTMREMGQMCFWEWGICAARLSASNPHKSQSRACKAPDQTSNLFPCPNDKHSTRKNSKTGVLPSIIARPRTLSPTIHLRIPIRLLGQRIQRPRRTRGRASAASTPARRARP
jgi:hypothetical protein